MFEDWMNKKRRIYKHSLGLSYEAFALEAWITAKNEERARCLRTVYDATDSMHEERDMILKDIIASAIKEQA